MSELGPTAATTFVVANSSETYPPGHSKSGGLSTNPFALVPEGATFVLARAGARVEWADLGRAAAATVSVTAGSTGLSSGLLDDEAATAALRGSLVGRGPIRLAFQVWSDDLAQLVRSLERGGVELDDGSIPEVSGATVAYWNTKRGGRELLHSVPELREHLPPLEFCSSARNLRQALLARTGPAVIKPNIGLGGEGIVVASSGTTTGAPADHQPAGWVIEDLVGEPTTNVSPTVDLMVHSDGVELCGVGLQLLEGHLSYVGVRDIPEAAPYRQPCLDIGLRAAQELRRRGYRGPLNVDFVVTTAGQVAIAEVNVRQSAPFEIFAAVEGQFGAAWPSTSFRSESLPGGTQSRPGPLAIDGARSDVAVVLAVDHASRGHQRLSVLSASSSRERLESVALEARRLVGPASDRQGEREPGADELESPRDASDAGPAAAAADDTSDARREHRELARRMRAVASSFRAENPLSRPTAETGSYAIPINWGGAPEAKPIAWFASPGCAWSLSGGCTMCDFSADATPVTVDQATADFVRHLGMLDPATKRIHLGPGGSFFDDREVPPALRAEVLGACAVLPKLRSVGLETRPGLVTVEKLMQAVETLPTDVADLTLGFGLECLDPLVREVAINKGYNTHHIDRAIDVIERVNAAQSRVRVDFEIYVLLKPLFLTERESIDEAVRTIKWSFARGATTVAMFLNTVKRNTVQGYLASRTDLDVPYRFVAPYYRSAVEVLRHLPSSARSWTVVLGTQSGVMADGLPSGCALCTPLMLGAIMGYNFTRDSAILEEAARSWCPCRAEWERSLEADASPMKERLSTGISVLEAAFGDGRPNTQTVRLRAKERA